MVIRGTNKRIIEISGEDDSCFERIVLFLKPEEQTDDQERALRLAEDYADGVMQLKAPALLQREKKGRGKLWGWLLFGGMALGLILLALLML